jgi:hypothetical protein
MEHQLDLISTNSNEESNTINTDDISKKDANILISIIFKKNNYIRNKQTNNEKKK